MSLTDDNTNGGSASAPTPTPYVFLIFAYVLQFLRLAIDLDMLDMLCSYRSLVNMVSLISMFLPILHLLFSWIKYHGKLLISPTEMTPYELWFGNKPKLSFLKVWGCDVYVKKLQSDKLEPNAKKCVFIGYPEEIIGYSFYQRSEGKNFCC
jgi:hypothetical protein